MNGGDARAHRGWVEATLPLRRRMTPVGCFECEQIGGISRAQARWILKDRHKFGVEVDVDALVVVVELEVRQQWHVGEDVLDEHRLAPAAMTDDKIRRKSPDAKFA